MINKYSHFYLVLLIAFIMQMTGCAKKEQEQKKEVIKAVRMAKVVQKETAIPFRTTGIVMFKTIISLSFKTGGIIEKIFVDEGASVSKENVLARLDLSEINAEVNKAISAFAKTKRDLSRIENLYNKKATTLENLQNAKTAAELAESNMKSALFNQKCSIIVSPSNGIILKRFKEENELASAGMPIFLFAQNNADQIIRVGVIDRDLVNLKAGDFARVSIDAYPGRVFSARVSEINELSDPKTGLYEVELTLENNKEQLFSGLVAKVEIIPSLKQRLFVIPMDAFTEGHGDKGFVFTVNRKTQKAVKIPVNISEITGDAVAISAGLEQVDDIVVSGALYLKDGDAVKILSSEPVK